MAPVIDAVAEELNDVKVGKINIDEESELASAFKIMSIPTIMLVNRGEVVNGVVGVRPKSDILALLNE